MMLSMSRCGNCWNTDAAGLFSSSLTMERIKKRVDKMREMATAEIFEYIKRSCNRTRRTAI